MRLETVALVLVVIGGLATGVAMLAGAVATVAVSPIGLLAVAPLVVGVVLLVAVVVQRLRSREDDHYDRIER